MNSDLHVKRVLGVLAHQAVGHDVKVSRLAGRVRGEGGRRVADGALQVQRAGGAEGRKKEDKGILQFLTRVRGSGVN